MNKRKIKQVVSGRRGIKIEENTRKILKETSDYNFGPGGNFIEKDFGNFKVCGISDGVDLNKSAILEIKSKNSLNLDSNLFTV